MINALIITGDMQISQIITIPEDVVCENCDEVMLQMKAGCFKCPGCGYDDDAY